MAGFASVRSYFRTRMNALGYTEWTDGFNFENIPNTLMSKKGRMYHISSPTSGRSDAYDMTSQDIDQDVVVRVFFKGYKDAASAIDAAMAAKDTILGDVLDAVNRTSVLTNVFYNNDQIIELNDTNDNAAILELNFIARIVLCV